MGVEVFYGVYLKGLQISTAQVEKFEMQHK